MVGNLFRWIETKRKKVTHVPKACVTARVVPYSLETGRIILDEPMGLSIGMGDIEKIVAGQAVNFLDYQSLVNYTASDADCFDEATPCYHDLTRLLVQSFPESFQGPVFEPLIEIEVQIFSIN